MSKCVLFDCDGTLVDSERLASRALAIKFSKIGIELNTDELVLKYRGWKLSNVLDNLCKAYVVKLSDSFVEDYRALVSELFEKELSPIEGIHSALEGLPYTKAVVSSGPLAKIQQALRVCNLALHFGDRLYSSYDTGFWKPDPNTFICVARAMGFEMADCIVIDDASLGVEAGVRAGMRTLFFNRFGESCKFKEAESFSSMDKLLELIDP